MAIAIAFVFFAVAAACLYASVRAMLADAGRFVLLLLALAAVNAAAGALNWTGASPVHRTVFGTLLCVYAVVALMWALARLDDAFVEGYGRALLAFAVTGVLACAAVLQFVYVA